MRLGGISFSSVLNRGMDTLMEFVQADYCLLLFNRWILTSKGQSMKIIPIRTRGESAAWPEKSAERRARLRSVFGMESLEDRRVFAVSTWSGAVNGLWSNAGNWDTPPNPGDDLVFPAFASQLTTLNDLPTGITYGNITFQDANYDLAGNGVLVSGTVLASQTSGTDTIGLGLGFVGTDTVNVPLVSANLALSGAISSINGLTKTGAGQLTLLNTASYNGAVNVNAGTLTNNANVNGAISLGTSSMLSGQGFSGSVTSIGGNINPGTGGTGLITTSGDFNLDSNSGLIVALNGTSPGTNYGQVAVGGQVTLGNATLIGTLGFSPSGNQSFTILNNTGVLPVSGTFAGLPEGGNLTIGVDKFLISYAGGDGNDVVLTRQMATTSVLTSSFNPSVYGQLTTLTAKVTAVNPTDGTPTGNVSFYNGTTLLAVEPLDVTGNATFDLSTLPVGNATLSAVFSGTAGFSNSTSANLTQVVNKAASLTTITTSLNPSHYGQSVTLTASVSAVSPGVGTPGGTVTFYNGNATLGTALLDANGSGALTTSSLPVGSLSIKANYTGDSNFATSNGPAITQLVNLATPNITLSVSTTNPDASGLITLTANLANPYGNGTLPTGSVDFYSNGVKIGSGNITAGVANMTTTGFYLGLGIDSITAEYAGDTNYDAATSEAANVTAGTDNERFINQAYAVIFNHQADYQGLNAWNTYLQHGHQRTWLVRKMRQSTAGQEALIEDIFTNYLGRSGSPAELYGAVNAALSTGTSARAIVLGSKEYYFGQGGGSIPTYLKAMEATMNTTFSSYAFEAMTQELSAGVMPAKVAQQALASHAGMDSLADLLYQTTLDRAPTAQEVDQFFSLTNQGIFWRFQQSHLMGSKEFFNYAINKAGQAPV